MKILRTFIEAILVAFTMIPSVSATSFSTNFSDIWATRGESGWAVNITMQSSAMFASWFVYGTDHKPVWYSATLEFTGVSTTGDLIFAGDLFETNGPWSGGPYDATQLTYRKVGVARFTTHLIESALLEYSVDGVNVAKQIERFTLRNDDLSGDYLGGTSDVTTGCVKPSDNTVYTDGAGKITISQTGANVSIQTDSCTFAGTYTQTGQVGAIAGNYSCQGGTSGPFTMFDIRVETSGITGRYLLRNQLCSRDGNFGGARLK